MSNDESTFVDRLRRQLARRNGIDTEESRRHPARDSERYGELKQETAADVEELCDRLVNELKTSIDEIDETLADVAEHLDDQLARGAVSDVFEAAAKVLREQVRRNGPSSGSN